MKVNKQVNCYKGKKQEIECILICLSVFYFTLFLILALSVLHISHVGVFSCVCMDFIFMWTHNYIH